MTNANIRLMVLSVLVGVVAGFAALAFSYTCIVLEHYALGVGVGFHLTHPHGEPVIAWLPKLNATFEPWLLLVVPPIGGLLCGLLVFTFAPEAEGHGTDAVIAAYHHKQGQIRPRVPLIKIVASALTLGSGGSGGREGPIAQVGAGFGSVLANLLGLSAREHRILVAAGMGAGIAAIFRAPLAGALFAAEVLYRSPDFESEVIIPAGIASVMAYCTFGSIFGWLPLFATPPAPFTDPLHLAAYAVLAAWMIVLATIYTHSFYGIKWFFQRVPLPRPLKPALGALCTGSVGLVLYLMFEENPRVLNVLSFGYGILQDGMGRDSTLTAGVLLAVALGKILTTGLSISSGGSGGVFGPSMVIGGCGGGALGMLLHAHFPNFVPHPSSFLIVGMAGFFAAAAKTPFSTIIMVSEITGDYSLLLPALWVCSLTFLFSNKKSIYSEQLKSPSQSPAHQGGFLHEILATVKVSEVLSPAKTVPVVHAHETLADVSGRLHDCPYAALPVIDVNHHVVGMLNLLDLKLGHPESKPVKDAKVGDVMQKHVLPLHPEDRLDKAARLFVDNELPALPVVKEHGNPLLVGILRRSDLAEVYVRLSVKEV